MTEIILLVGSIGAFSILFVIGCGIYHIIKWLMENIR